MEAPWLERVRQQLDDRPLCAWCLAQGRITVAAAVAYADRELEFSAEIASTIRQTRQPSWDMLPTSGSTATRSTVVIHGTGRAPQGVRRYKLPQALSPIAGDRPAGDEREGEREDSAVELQIRGAMGIRTPPKAVAIVVVSSMFACVPKSTLEGFLKVSPVPSFAQMRSTPPMNVSLRATALAITT